jgi:hypothetical protein
MMTHSEERDQLVRLHDRHKRFSLDVYDHLTASEEAHMLKAQRDLRQVEKELEDLKKKLLAKKGIKQI